jgi:hypothetical protein
MNESTKEEISEQLQKLLHERGGKYIEMARKTEHLMI